MRLILRKKMKNKKGGFLFRKSTTWNSLLVLFALLIFWFMFIRGNVVTIDCTAKILTLKAINGISDYDTGFFAGGTTRQKNLLFDNGLLLTFSDYEIEEMGIDLYLNKTYVVKKCYKTNSKKEFNWDKEYYEIEDVFINEIYSFKELNEFGVKDG